MKAEAKNLFGDPNLDPRAIMPFSSRPWERGCGDPDVHYLGQKFITWVNRSSEYSLLGLDSKLRSEHFHPHNNYLNLIELFGCFQVFLSQSSSLKSL